MLKSVIFFLLLTTLSFAENKKYTYSLDNSITTFCVLNFNQLKSDILNEGGEYSESLFSQMKVSHNKKNLNSLKEIILSNSSDFDKISEIKRKLSNNIN